MTSNVIQLELEQLKTLSDLKPDLSHLNPGPIESIQCESPR
jgi:hypothetical protein